MKTLILVGVFVLIFEFLPARLSLNVTLSRLRLLPDNIKLQPKDSKEGRVGLSNLFFQHLKVYKFQVIFYRINALFTTKIE